MNTGRTDKIRKDAVRIALSSGLSRRQVADAWASAFQRFRRMRTLQMFASVRGVLAQAQALLSAGAISY